MAEATKKAVAAKPGAGANDESAGGGDKLEAGVDYPKVDSGSGVVEVAPNETPDAGGDDLLSAAQVKAPNLTREVVSKHKLDDDYLARVARGEEPPPPVHAEVAKAPATTDGELHLTDGGWQITPKGVKPEDVGKNAISR